MPDLSGLDVLLSIGGDSDDRILAAMTSGAKGLLFKDAAPDNLVDCVREVANGKLCFPNDLLDAALERASGQRVFHRGIDPP